MNDKAVLAYARAVTHDASLVQSPFWGSDPFRLANRNKAIAASLLTDCRRAGCRRSAGFKDDLAAWADGCHRQVDASPGDARARSDLAMTLFALGRDDEALAEARRAVARSTDNAYARTALGVATLDRGHGDLAAARKELALGADLGDPDAIMLLVLTYRAPPGAARCSQTLVSRPKGRPCPQQLRTGSRPPCRCRRRWSFTTAFRITTSASSTTVRGSCANPRRPSSFRRNG